MTIQTCKQYDVLRGICISTPHPETFLAAKALAEDHMTPAGEAR